MSNLLESPTYKIEDRRKILMRVLGALLTDRDCRTNFRGEWKPLSVDETANWDARCTVADLLQEFPAKESPLPIHLPLEAFGP
jgi:hypothetical protein